MGLGGGAYRTQTKPESRTVRVSLDEDTAALAAVLPTPQHCRTIACRRKDHDTRCLRPAPIVHGTPRRGGAPSAQTARRARCRGGCSQSRHRSAVARSLAVGQITTHPPWPLQPTGLPAPRSTGTRRAHARAKHRRCCCPWRRAAWRPAVLPSSPEREEHARAVAVSPRTAADENAEQCDCLSGSSGCGGESQFEVSEWLVARVGTCSTAAAGQR